MKEREGQEGEERGGTRMKGEEKTYQYDVTDVEHEEQGLHVAIVFVLQPQVKLL